jgi:hypothetical protein
MVELKRTIRCSGCGSDTNFYMSSEMDLNELLIHGNCSRCGNSLQLNFNIVEKEGKEEEAASESTTVSQEEEPSVNLEEALSNETNEFPSEAIKDLMGN